MIMMILLKNFIYNEFVFNCFKYINLNSIITLYFCFKKLDTFNISEAFSLD